MGLELFLEALSSLSLVDFRVHGRGWTGLPHLSWNAFEYSFVSCQNILLEPPKSLPDLGILAGFPFHPPPSWFSMGHVSMHERFFGLDLDFPSWFGDFHWSLWNFVGFRGARCVLCWTSPVQNLQVDIIPRH
jgi:hypothetical protein